MSGSSVCPRCLRVTCPRSLTQWFGTWWAYRIYRCGTGNSLWFCVFSLSLLLVRRRCTIPRCPAVSSELQRHSSGLLSCCRGKFLRSAAKLLVNFRGKFPVLVREGSISRGQHAPRSRRVLARSRVPVCSYSGRGPIFGNDAFCKRFSLNHLAQQVFESVFVDGEPFPPSSLHGALLHIRARGDSQSFLLSGLSDVIFCQMVHGPRRTSWPRSWKSAAVWKIMSVRLYEPRHFNFEK